MTELDIEANVFWANSTDSTIIQSCLFAYIKKVGNPPNAAGILRGGIPIPLHSNSSGAPNKWGPQVYNAT
jgi:hypothetical protein